MGRLPHSEPASRRDQIVQAAMTHAGVEHLAGRLYPGLSGGERQRVQFARVLAQIWQEPSPGRLSDPEEPRLLLLDEPTAGLTRAESDRLLGILRRGHAGTALLLVAHDIDIVFGHCDRVVVMELGRVIRVGTPGEVRADAEVRRAYLGSAA